MEEREGYVESIRFHSPDTGFTVLSLSGDKPGEELTCVGSFPLLEEGEYIRVRGELTQHSIYGKQLKVDSYEITQPTDADSMERYLGSGAIKGIGMATAVKIIAKFGDDTFRIIEREPERLAEIRGISDRIAQSVHEQFMEKQNMRRVVMYLLQLGINLNQGLKIYRRYGESTIDVVGSNPYRLAEDITGFGFRTADEIARRIGGMEYSDNRFRACLLHVMRLGAQAGHAYLPKESLLTHAQEFIPEMDEDSLDRALVALVIERKMRTVEMYDDNGTPQTHVYLSVYYHTEQAIARMLLDIDEGGRKVVAGMDRMLEDVERREDIDLDEIQERAVREAMEHGVFVLTGGPGTGKTTTINTIIRMCEAIGREVVLAAPTGRAAKRMTETTGRDAVTIHRLLEVTNMGDDGDVSLPKFRRNEEYPLETDVVIIDEVSMVDMHLMYSLLRAIVPGMTSLILVGDANQLPSVGPGNVLHDIMASGAFSIVKLEKIFRQDEASDIVINAHRINRGEYPDLGNKSKDFFFLQRRDASAIRPHGAAGEGQAAVVHTRDADGHSGPDADAQGRPRSDRAQRAVAGGAQSAGRRQAAVRGARSHIPSRRQGHADTEQLPARVGGPERPQHADRERRGDLQRRYRRDPRDQRVRQADGDRLRRHEGRVLRLRAAGGPRARLCGDDPQGAG